MIFFNDKKSKERDKVLILHDWARGISLRRSVTDETISGFLFDLYTGKHSKTPFDSVFDICRYYKMLNVSSPSTILESNVKITGFRFHRIDLDKYVHIGNGVYRYDHPDSDPNEIYRCTYIVDESKFLSLSKELKMLKKQQHIKSGSYLVFQVNVLKDGFYRYHPSITFYADFADLTEYQH